MYSKLKKDLQERLSACGQLRNKLKKLISECKKAALTVKTATGIDRLQEQKNYGSWFPMLFSLVKTRDSCQPKRAVEPSTGRSEDVEGQSSASPASSLEESAIECMEKLLERDPTKELLKFYKEENEKARRHERQLMQMIMSVQQPTEHVQRSTPVKVIP